jgi:hypothetical protein
VTLELRVTLVTAMALVTQQLLQVLHRLHLQAGLTHR